MQPRVLPSESNSCSGNRGGDFRRTIPFGFLFLLPVLYLALVLWLQPADRLGAPEGAPWLGRWLYDDYDPAARALRGLNATLGKTAGRPDEPPWLGPEEFCQTLDKPQEAVPDAPYFLEYPHAALLLFRLGYAFGNQIQGQQVPAAVSGGDFHDLVEHLPRNEAERNLWGRLRQAIRVYAVLGTLCLLGLMVVLRAGYCPGAETTAPLFLLVLPASLYFALHRFDVVPALLTALSLACLGRRRVLASALCLAAASMIKVYPVLLAPLVLRFLSVDRRTMLAWAAAYGGTVIAFLVPPLVLSGWRATWAPYHFQLSRAAEYGWAFYGFVLPLPLADNRLPGTLFRTGSVIVAVGWLAWQRPTDLTSLLRRATMALILFVSLQVFYSPQWLLWFSPFLVPLASTRRSVLRLAVALDVTTFLSFPVVYDLTIDPIGPILRVMLIYIRFAILAGLIGVLGLDEFRKGIRNNGPVRRFAAARSPT